MGELTPPRGTNELAGLVHLPHKSIASPILMRERGKRNGNKTQPKTPDSLRRAASQAATRLLRCATALRVTAPHGCGSGGWYGRKLAFGFAPNMNNNILYHALVDSCLYGCFSKPQDVGVEVIASCPGHARGGCGRKA